MMITHTPSPPPRRNSQTPMGGSFIHSHGTKVFVPHRIDHVQDAVNQARFSERRWVWVQDEEYAYIRAHILNENGNKVEVELENGMVNINTSEERERKREKDVILMIS